jgi:hypothetical protein
MVVREAAPEVMYRVLAYRRSLLHPDLSLPHPSAEQCVTGPKPSSQE